ncbi:hypothetical protein APHAL10511_003573 [Amanita phalloides]|nr:hypothetical protein APHAL10511_003573 [Amanita phalloides]
MDATAKELATLLENAERRQKQYRSDSVELERFNQEFLAGFDRRRQELVDDLERRKIELISEFDMKNQEFISTLDSRYQEVEEEEVKWLMNVTRHKATIASSKGLPRFAAFFPQNTLLETTPADLKHLDNGHSVYTGTDFRDALRDAKEALRLLDRRLSRPICDTRAQMDIEDLRERAQEAVNIFETALSPNRRLPSVVLEQIFLCCIEDDPTMHIVAEDRPETPDYIPESSDELSESELADEDFPYDGESEDEPAELPIQLALSHVCSRWRTIALSTKQLWRNVNIMPFNEESKAFAQEWLSRAGNLHVSISITEVDYCTDSDLHTILIDFLSAYKLRDLELPLYSATWPQIPSILSELPLKCVAELESLSLYDTDFIGSEHISFRSSRYPNLKRIALDGNFNMTSFMLPWKTLRHLDLDSEAVQLDDFLRECVLLETCSLYLSYVPSAPFNAIRLPKLRELSLSLASGHGTVRNIFHSLDVPNLEILVLDGASKERLTAATLDSLEFPRLRHLSIGEVSFVLHVPALLNRLPSLEEITLPHSSSSFIEEAVDEKETMDKLATGIIGPRLRKITVGHFQEKDNFLDMISRRADFAKQQAGNVQQITPINMVSVCDLNEELRNTEHILTLRQKDVTLIITTT